MLTRSRSRAICNASRLISFFESLPDDTLELIRAKLPTNTYLLAKYPNIVGGKVCLRLATHPTTNEVHMIGTIYMTLDGLDAGYMVECIQDHLDLSLNSSLLVIEGSNNRTFFVFESVVLIETPLNDSEVYREGVLFAYEQQARHALDVFFNKHPDKKFAETQSVSDKDKKHMEVRLVCSSSVIKYDSRSSTSTFEFEAGTYMHTQGNFAAVSRRMHCFTVNCTDAIRSRVAEEYRPLLSKFASVA